MSSARATLVGRLLAVTLPPVGSTNDQTRDRLFIVCIYQLSIHVPFTRHKQKKKKRKATVKSFKDTFEMMKIKFKKQKSHTDSVETSTVVGPLTVTTDGTGGHSNICVHIVCAVACVCSASSMCMSILMTE